MRAPIFVLVLLVAATTDVYSGVSVDLEAGEGGNSGPTLPAFLGGPPEDQQVHAYSSGVVRANHTAQGPGLHHANVGVPASFTILLADVDDSPPHEQWNVQSKLLMYVWIANPDQIFIAEVVNNGDGSLTATYESSFPGNYSVHIEVVTKHDRDEGEPIIESPLALTIEGDASLDLGALPVCGTEEEDIPSTFWRPGTWVSSNIASTAHGVMRDGWVYQPKTCVYDTFSFNDLMLLAELTEPTWIVVLGGSVQRGVFLTLVDMALAQGQKDHFGGSALMKCWGYADIQVGNLRFTYQDFRLYTVDESEDETVCNNEKLESGSTATYVRSCKHFLDWVIFQEGADWPSVVLAPSNLVNREDAPNLAIEVVMAALPENWQGKLVMVDHMAGFGFHWAPRNPTMTALEDVDMKYHGHGYGSDNGFGKMTRYQEEDPRTSFMSVFPMYQSKLFENQNTRDGKRWYGGSVHYHHGNTKSSEDPYSGAKIIISTMTEMISHIVIAKAVGTKQALYASSTTNLNSSAGRTSVPSWFTMCTDCPSGLLPFHVQPKPQPVCANISDLPGDAPMGEVWDKSLCPEWCLATEPVGQTPTESGPVDVRICPVEISPP